MAKALRRAKRPTKERTPTGESYWVQLGTPNELGEKKMVATEGAAREAIAKHFHSKDGFIERHVRERDEVLKNIADVLGELNSSYIGLEPKQFEVLIDPYYNMRLAGRAWKGLK